MTSLGAIFPEVAILVLVVFLNVSVLEAKRFSSFRYGRYSYYYSGSSAGDSTEAIISVSVILGFIAFVVIFSILWGKCCPNWSPKESIEDCFDNCKNCKACSKKEPEIKIAASLPTERRLKAKRKNTWAPVKKHMATLRLALHTPKPVLLKRESKKLEKDISLYETNPTHYRDFMEPPPAYEYVVAASTETEKNEEDKSEFLQNRQRISRISRTISTLHFDQMKKATTQSLSERPRGPESLSQAQRSGQPANSRILARTRSGPLY